MSWYQRKETIFPHSILFLKGGLCKRDLQGRETGEGGNEKMKVLPANGRMREYWLEHLTSSETWSILRCGRKVVGKKEESERMKRKKVGLMENSRACPQRHGENLNGTACSRLCVSSPLYACASAWQVVTVAICSTFDFSFVHETEVRSFDGIWPVEKRWASPCDQPAKSVWQKENSPSSHWFYSCHPADEVVDGYYRWLLLWKLQNINWDCTLQKTCSNSTEIAQCV